MSWRDFINYLETDTNKLPSKQRKVSRIILDGTYGIFYLGLIVLFLLGASRSKLFYPNNYVYLNHYIFFFFFIFFMIMAFVSRRFFIRKSFLQYFFISILIVFVLYYMYNVFISRSLFIETEPLFNMNDRSATSKISLIVFIFLILNKFTGPFLRRYNILPSEDTNKSVNVTNSNVSWKKNEDINFKIFLIILLVFFLFIAGIIIYNIIRFY